MDDTPAKPAKILSNGMTHLENVRRLQHDTQGPLERDLSFCACTWDIPNGIASSHQCVDIYTPKCQEGLFPTIIYIHGGDWFTGDRSRVIVELAHSDGHNIKGDFMRLRKLMRIDFMKKHLLATQAQVFEQENDDYL